MLKITGVGHKDSPSQPDKIQEKKKSMVVYRRWRLGDLIMCEPVNRYWSRHGYQVSFCTFNQYHPIVKSYIETPPKTITYHVNKDGSLVNPGYKYNEEYYLDNVDLLHEGHTSKVEAFLASANIDYNNIEEEYKTPQIDVSTVHTSWAKQFLKNNQLENLPLIAVFRNAFASNTPRSIPPSILDNLYQLLASKFHVIVIGEKPIKIIEHPQIHNFTGCTPDVMSVAGLLSQCKTLITVDTGLMHLAGAIGLPMISILGPTRPQDVSSFYHHNSIIDMGRECSPCFDRGCDNRCLEQISADFIYEVAIDRINMPFAETLIITSR